MLDLENSYCTSEPLILYGKGDYALTAVQEIDVTEDFLNLNKQGTHHDCQNVETYQECQSKEYIKMGLEKCNCTLYALRDFSKKVNGILSYLKKYIVI